ncbi:hypothetical protein pEp_SNUABM10_00034 [Erwinia phage pEp_SNUABM_10]|nr:hypothetical protein pEp_SNUABM03_00031 [Erwinia phage pEp_SNUABM_03]QOC57688.1 hypothetical protein pEp_SNUABM04_00034 [Erwinia phage pEp_SNUABM_04]QOC57738.1 hypothetical protein pEp_SNUABM10_00034 [Erwinia phage pEp_SNUABM_10]QOC57790.1 hypothetical protein pEp_SNUABM11_00034 [Erwinia phage pEp_SNUABM_11]
MRKTMIAIAVMLALVSTGCVYSPTVLVNSDVTVSTK